MYNCTYLTYINNLFIALSNNGKVATSVNGTNWIITTNSYSYQWNSVTYGNNIYVAVTQNYNGVFTSPDAITWTLRAHSYNETYNSITYANNLFVAVSGGGRIITSSNGINWLRKSAPILSYYRCVIFANNLFVAVGDREFITSQDGINWNAISVPECYWSSITYGNNLFMAMGSNGLADTRGKRCMISTDGINWQLQNVVADDFQWSWKSISYGNNYFVSVARANYYTQLAGNFFLTARTPTLTNFSNIVKTIGDAPFTITAPNSNSLVPFTFITSNVNVATILGSTVTIVNTGTCEIIASQAASSSYTPGVARATLTINKVKPTLVSFNVPLSTFGDSPFTLTKPSSNSTGSFVYTSSNLEVATISGSTVTIIKAGTITITAIQEESSNYSSASISTTFVVNPALLELTNFSVLPKILGDRPFTLTKPSSNITCSYVYTSSNLEVATISGSTVIIIKEGTTTITAKPEIVTNYTLPTTISALFTVDVATASNPVKITDSSSLTYFLTTPSKFVSITNSIVLDVPLKASTTTTKTISASGSKIVKLTARKR